MSATTTTERPQSDASATDAPARDTGSQKPWRPQSMIEDNPVGLPEEVAEELIPKLDEIQSTLWTMYHQYHKHHWLVEGPQFRDLHHFLEEHYQEVHKYTDRIAERITALGGIPTSAPANQAKLSHVEHEPEGTFRIRQSLENDLAAERTLAVLVRETIDSALELKDHGTKRQLERLLTATEDRAHHLDHFLGEDTLDNNILDKA